MQSNKILKELYSKYLKKHGVKNTFQLKKSVNKAKISTKNRINKTLDQFKLKVKKINSDVEIISYENSMFICKHGDHKYKIP